MTSVSRTRPGPRVNQDPVPSPLCHLVLGLSQLHDSGSVRHWCGQYIVESPRTDTPGRVPSLSVATATESTVGQETCNLEQVPRRKFPERKKEGTVGV